MAASRYWRLNQVESYLGEGLALSDVALYNGGSRVDGSATLSCTVAQDSGTMWSGTVTWSESSVSTPGFAFVWDFGSSTSVDEIRVTGPTQSSFLHKFTLQTSSDAVTWTDIFSPLPSTKWMGVATAWSSSLTYADANWADVVVAMPLDDLGMLDAKRHITLTRNVTSSSSVVKYYGNSANFPGTGYLTVESHADLAFGTGDVTVEFWLYLSNASATAFLFDMRPQTVNGAYPFVQLSSGSIIFYVNSATRISAAHGISSNTWVHIAWCRASGTSRLFVGGTQKGSNYADTFDYLQSAVRIGINAYDLSTAGLVGNICDFRITKYARYTSGFTPPGAMCADHDTAQLRVQGLVAPVVVGSSVVGDTQITAPAITTAIDREDGGLYRVTGTVKEKANPSNIPLRRKVRLHRENDGRLIRETWSDATTGEYTFNHIRGDAVYFVTTFDHLQTYRAVIADNLTAELMS